MYSVFKYQDLRRTVENKTFLLEEGFVSDSDAQLLSVELRFRYKDQSCHLFEISNTKFQIKTGGDDRSRTCDPLNANQVLSQLSYIPKKLVAGTGFEPATFGL